MGDVQVEIDVNRCYGSGDCELALPQAFRVGDDGTAQVLSGAADVPACELEQVARACPTSAIVVRDC